MVQIGTRLVPESLTELLDSVAADHPHATLRFEGTTVPYAALPARVKALAGWLVDELGVQAGDHVAIWMPNCIEWIDAWFATARIGAVLVPLNTRFAAAEAEYVLRQSGSTVLLRADGVGQLSGERVAGLLADPSLALAASAVIGGEPAHLDERAWPSDPRDAAPPAVEDGHAAGMIQYTSGSTAFPKGAVLANAGMIRNAEGMAHAWHVSNTDTVLCSNPLFHCGGSVFAFLAAFVQGAPVVLMDRWSPEAGARTMEEEGVTVFPGIDAAVRDLVAHVRAGGSAPTGLRLVTTAADPDLFAAANALIGCEVSNVFGLTESSPNVCVGDLDDPTALRIERIGRAQPGLEVEIRDPLTGAVLPSGRTGTIHVRGWSLMLGYHDDPDATAAAIGPDGFLGTGDLGELDEQGYLAYKGRQKQMIKSGGENVSIEEVEEALRSHPEVGDAVLVPVPHPRFVEVGFAFVRPLRGAIDLAELDAHVRTRLAGFKVPKHLHVVDDLPRTGSGKVDRRTLGDMASVLVTEATS